MLESVVTIIAVVVVGFPLLMYLAQDSLIFFPQPQGEARRAQIASQRAVESRFIDAADGTRLHAWHVKGEPLVMYFGGNAEEVSWMLDDAARRAPGTGWLLVDYRGYGSSGGSPSENALVADALRWYDHLSPEHRKIYLFGRSLGSGVAVQLAAHRPVAGLILVAPFDSLVAVGKRHYPFLPVDWMLKHRFDSIALAPQLKAPLLCIVATADEIIPAEHSKRLYDAWGGEKRWVALEGAGHNSTDNAANYWTSIAAFLK
ncbi:MAG TPA: alpha/beta fold hydrolase [Burkholderiales bacterium]|nr:alpha/beta fold hydrolase [Burkholderiales bacterium]